MFHKTSTHTKQTPLMLRSLTLKTQQFRTFQEQELMQQSQFNVDLNSPKNVHTVGAQWVSLHYKKFVI